MLTAVRLRAWLAIFIAALGLYLVGRWQGAQAVAGELVVREAQTALAVGKPYRARQDSLRLRMLQQLGFAQAWRHQADSLRARAVRVDTLVVPDSSALGLWRATANASRAEASQCGLALATCGERAQTAEARNVVLEGSTAALLKLRNCHVLFVKCPSRVTTGIVAFGAGLLGGVLLTR